MADPDDPRVPLSYAEPAPYEDADGGYHDYDHDHAEWNSSPSPKSRSRETIVKPPPRSLVQKTFGKRHEMASADDVRSLKALLAEDIMQLKEKTFFAVDVIGKDLKEILRTIGDMKASAREANEELENS